MLTCFTKRGEINKYTTKNMESVDTVDAVDAVDAVNVIDVETSQKDEKINTNDIILYQMN